MISPMQPCKMGGGFSLLPPCKPGDTTEAFASQLTGASHALAQQPCLLCQPFTMLVQAICSGGIPSASCNV